jgi:glycosyltransferase involved in cell wall biosynthesis
MLHSMLRALAGRGHQIDVSLSIQTGDPYELDGVTVWPHESKRDVFRWLGDADVMISHLMNTPRATFLGRWNKVPVVLVHHNTFERTKHALITAEARVDLVVVNSEWMRDDLGRWFAAQGALPPPTVIVRPLVDPDEYATTPGDRITMVNLQRTGEGPEAIGKGGEVFWRIARRMPRTRFLGVVGAYGDQVVEELPNVEVLAHVPHHRMRDDVYGRTRILLCPSKYESWGRAAAEATCSGIPVIAHPTPGLVESLGDAGIFVDRDNIDGWIAAIRRLSSAAQWAQASKRVRRRAEELRPEGDLERWCDAIEVVASRGLVSA